MDAGDPLDGRLGDQRLRIVMLALAEAHIPKTLGLKTSGYPISWSSGGTWPDRRG